MGRATFGIIMALAVCTHGAIQASERRTPQGPPGHHAIASATMKAGVPKRSFVVVAYAVDDEGGYGIGDAPPRPLVVYEIVKGIPKTITRNDHVVMGRDEGGQCDPFDSEDAGGHIVSRGRWFTVENGVACGSHWTSYVTFRLDDRAGFVFDNLRSESWILNRDPKKDGDALIRRQPTRVVRGDPRKPVPLSAWSMR